MQRQSLGGSSSSSPSSKLHLCEENDQVEKKKRLVVTDSDIDDEEVVKKKTIEKNHHHRSCFTQNEKSIHLIPILTILCILILYLVSYDPSQKDLVNIDGFRNVTSKKIPDSERVDISDFRRDDVLEIKSHRTLHGIHKDAANKESRFHRKFGDF